MMTELVECPECQKKCKDFTPESEFIGWFGICFECSDKLPSVSDIGDGEEL